MFGKGAFHNVRSALTGFRRLVSECRASDRRSFETPADLVWRDGEGRITHTRGVCLDVSESGARIAYSQPIKLPAVVQIRPDSDRILRTGDVRHFTPNGSRYEYGIEFRTARELRGA